ncbi:unnamed protein product [Urochloa humidicola]
MPSSSRAAPRSSLASCQGVALSLLCQGPRGIHLLLDRHVATPLLCALILFSSVSSAFNSPMSVSSLMTATSRWQHRELLVPVAPLLFPAGLRSPEMAESLKLKGYQEVMDTMVMPWTHDNNYKDYNGMDEEESCDDYLL